MGVGWNKYLFQELNLGEKKAVPPFPHPSRDPEENAKESLV